MDELTFWVVAGMCVLTVVVLKAVFGWDFIPGTADWFVGVLIGRYLWGKERD